MDKRTAAADLKARNEALLERARTALDEFAEVRARVSRSMEHSRELLAELGNREFAAVSLERIRRRRLR